MPGSSTTLGRPDFRGFPCCVDPPVHACRRQYPGGAAGCMFRSLPQRRRPSPFLRRVGLHITLFGACSAFTTRFASQVSD